MRCTTLRRGSGALLLTALLAACSDGPTGPSPLARPAAPPAPVGGAYRSMFSTVPAALFGAHEAASTARHAGASEEEAAAAARREAGALLRESGPVVEIRDTRANDRDALAILTAGQRAYLERIEAAVADLGPGVSPAELEARLARIEAGARAELSDAEREPILMAIAAVAEFWEAAAPTAQFALLPAGPLEVARGGERTTGTGTRKDTKKATFTWAGLADSVAKGAVLGAVGGAMGGARVAGGAGAAMGGAMGAIGGAVTGGLDYLIENRGR